MLALVLSLLMKLSDEQFNITRVLIRSEVKFSLWQSWDFSAIVSCHYCMNW